MKTSDKIKKEGSKNKFTESELLGFYEKVKGSSNVYHNRKKYYRPSDKKERY